MLVQNNCSFALAVYLLNEGVKACEVLIETGSAETIRTPLLAETHPFSSGYDGDELCIEIRESQEGANSRTCLVGEKKPYMFHFPGTKTVLVVKHCNDEDPRVRFSDNSDDLSPNYTC